MFGCYRRDEAADPDTFVAAVTMVLAHYPAEVVDAVTDPYAGIPSRKNAKGYSGLPDVADVKEACEAEAARLARLKGYKKLDAPRRAYALPAELKATIFTAQGYPRYDALVKRYETEPSVCFFANHRCIDDVVRYGIWVPYSWVAPEARGPMRTQQR